MKTYSIIKRNYGVELNNSNAKKYATKEEATKSGNSWLNDSPLGAEISREGWNFEIIENN